MRQVDRCGPHPPLPALATTWALPVATPRDAEVKCWADKAYQGGDGVIPVLFRSLCLKLRQRRHNSTHAEICCLGEQAMAALKAWCLPRKLRRSTNRVTAIVKTVPALLTPQPEVGKSSPAASGMP
ncbi:hypothetical protein [Streptomyces sp. DW26H14]|uniref:hypothetical protein n=1 Tax=Streptomyces sp. DW26H14 TaxID=3435395 RepID=UPI00403D5EC8